MTDIIIFAVIAVIVGFGVMKTMKHFKGEGDCCGGGTYKAKVKKLDRVVAKKTFAVEGMSCQHCINRVQEAVNSIEGASGVVNLKKGVVVVSMERMIEDEEIMMAIEKAHYKVSGIV